ncbi:uncharacterized protein [Haliotis asinina]|uniref:uncharacterized protein n=1 Tax=Haliotis asinina TaxID=109174 RepID=UPI0035320FB4
MMLLFVCLLYLPLSVLGDDRDAHLYRVNIYMPPEKGRDETAEIRQIKDTVNDLTDIKVLFSFKELGNPRILLVLDVEKPGSWSQLTGFLSRKGYEFSAVSLYQCGDFAKGLGVSIPDDMWSSSFEDEDLLMDRKTLLVGDLSTLEYNEMLKWTFEKDVALRKSGQKQTCFKTLAVFPVELMYFAPVSQHVMDEMEEYLRGPRRFQNEVTRIQNLDHYT